MNNTLALYCQKEIRNIYIPIYICMYIHKDPQTITYFEDADQVHAIYMYIEKEWNVHVLVKFALKGRNIA